jgi:hypothetical protein
MEGKSRNAYLSFNNNFSRIELVKLHGGGLHFKTFLEEKME